MERMRMLLVVSALLVNSTGCKTLPTKGASQLSAEEEKKAEDKETWPRLGTYSAKTTTRTKIGSKPARVSSVGSTPSTLRLSKSTNQRHLNLGGRQFSDNGGEVKDDYVEKWCPRQKDPTECWCGSYAKTMWLVKRRPTESAKKDQRQLLQIENSVVETLVETKDKNGKAAYSYKKQNCKALVGRTDTFVDTSAEKNKPDYLHVNEIRICLTDDGQLAELGNYTRKIYTCEKKNDKYIDESPKLSRTETVYIDAIREPPSRPDLDKYTAEIVFVKSGQPPNNDVELGQRITGIKFSIETKARKGDQNIIRFVKWGGPGFPTPGKDHTELTHVEKRRIYIDATWVDDDGNFLGISFKVGSNDTIIEGLGVIKKNGVERSFYIEQVKKDQ